MWLPMLLTLLLLLQLKVHVTEQCSLLLLAAASRLSATGRWLLFFRVVSCLILGQSCL